MSVPTQPVFEEAIRVAVREIVNSEVLPAVREAVRTALASEARTATPRKTEAARATKGPGAQGDDEAAWSLKQVASYLGVSESLVRKWECSGKLMALPRTSTRLTFDPALVRSFRDNGTMSVVPMKLARK